MMVPQKDAAVEGAKPASPHKPRHQVTRSTSELSSPIRLHRHHNHETHSRHHSRDGRDPAGAADRDGDRSPTQSSSSLLGGLGHAHGHGHSHGHGHGHHARRSLDVIIGSPLPLRTNDGATPEVTPLPSRPASLLIPNADEDTAMVGAGPRPQQLLSPLVAPPGLPKERQLQIAKERNASSAEYVVHMGPLRRSVRGPWMRQVHRSH